MNAEAIRIMILVAAFASIFLVTSLSLAVMSSKSGQSIMPQKVAAPVLPEELADITAPETTDVSEDIVTNPVTSEELPGDVQPGL